MWIFLFAALLELKTVMKRLTYCRSCQTLRRRCRCCPGTASGRRRNTSSPQSRACARLKGSVAYQCKDRSSPQSLASARLKGTVTYQGKDRSSQQSRASARLKRNSRKSRYGQVITTISCMRSPKRNSRILM
jgi:hypothetical protein